jgi:pilus assembly protein CpaC
MQPLNFRRAPQLAPALVALAVALITVLLVPNIVHGQVDVQTQAEGIVTISRGSSAILTIGDSITRVSVADPAVADPVVIPPRQVVVNALSPGSTSLVIWGLDNLPRMYTVEVTADIASLQREIDELFPGAGLTVRSTGSSIVLGGEVRDAQIVRKAIELAETMNIPIVNNVQSPSAEQILLHVEFAEVSKAALKEMGRDLLRVINPQNVDNLDDNSLYDIASVSEGIVSLLIAGEGTEIQGIFRALKNTNDFVSLAQPNLVTREGQEASFLAGGEFPFPIAQGDGSNTVTITWKEFGIRLNFVPNITNSGNIRLHVAPEVSSLDFANGLTISGFSIPTILARRVETDVELRPGETLAIGGLMDHTISKDVDKIPLLGDIPILGYFFRSEKARQDMTELLVLVTPYVLDSNALPAPPLPTGRVEDWPWERGIRNWMRDEADRPRLGDPVALPVPATTDGGAR